MGCDKVSRPTNKVQNLSAVTKKSDVPLVINSSSTSTFSPPEAPTSSTTDFYDFSYTARPSPHWQTIGNYSSQESTEKGYNEKYNVDQVPEDSITNEEEVGDKQKIESERGMSPTMSLVIGIIIGSFTAMILIVIIVLKVRTGVDLSEM